MKTACSSSRCGGKSSTTPTPTVCSPAWPTLDYVHHLRDLRRMRPYTLEERSEQVINLKDADGIGGLLTAYSMLTNRLEFQPAARARS